MANLLTTTLSATPASSDTLAELLGAVGRCDGCLPGLVVAMVFVPLVPVTHSLGGRVLFGKRAWSPRATFLRGGKSFIVFQALTWTFWALALLAAVAAWVGGHHVAHHELAPVAAGCAVCGSVLAEVLVVASLLTFQEPAFQQPAQRAGAPSTPSAPPHRRTQSEVLAVDFDFGWDDEDEDYEMVVGAQQPQQPAPSPVKPGHRRFASAQASSGPPRAQVAVEHAPAASLHPAQPYLLLHALRGRLGATVIIALSLLLVLMGQSLVASVALDAVAGTARLIFVSIAAVSVAIAAPVTHGVAGPLRHAHSGFKFWQPGMGGLAFVACQALGWALYAISVLAFITAFWALGTGGYAALCFQADRLPLSWPRLPRLPHWAVCSGMISDALTGYGVRRARVLPATFWAAGVSGVAAQVVLALSLLAFRAPSPAAQPLPWRMPDVASVREAAAKHACMFAVLLMVYAPSHLLCAVVSAPYLLLTPPAATALLVVLGAVYGHTYMGHPGHTGARTWLTFQRYSEQVLSVALSRWFGSVHVIRSAAHPPRTLSDGSAAPPVVFGYHPHGMYPAAAAWFHLTPQWRAAFPGHSLVTMGASAIFWTPMLRDVVMWSGARIVSRTAVRRALLGERRSIVLCPGGQAELVEHRAGSETVLCTRHKGFLKFAIEAGAPVCPIFVFGEAHAQRNLLQVKGLQKWTAKKLGFPFPFIPGGYLRVLPLPEPKPLTFVVGALVEPPAGREAGAPATPEEIDALHAVYYAALRQLFEKHKAEAGFPGATLVLKAD